MKEIPFIEKRQNKDPQFNINFGSSSLVDNDLEFYEFLDSTL